MSSPIQLSHFSGWFALLLLVLLAAPVVLLGMRSLAGLGPARKWVAIGVRLAVLLLLVLILGGITWTRRAKDVHVVVLRDVSESPNQVRTFPGPSLDESINDFLRAGTKVGDQTAKKSSDRIGVISFAQRAYVDSVADTQLRLDARAIRERGTGTDTASALQLGLATLHKDALHRMLLIWDGNQTTGDLEAAVNAAVAARVPIDVMPLTYDVRNEVLVDKLLAPTWKRENEPFTIEVFLSSTNPLPTKGRLTVTHQGLAMDLDPTTAGMQPTRVVTLKPSLNNKPGQTVERIMIPPLADAGVHQFRSVFEADDPTQQSGVAVGAPGSAPGTGTGGGATNAAKTDTIAANNVANAFTFVRGKGRVLYIDNVAGGRGDMLRQALRREGIEMDEQRSRVDQFPASAMELQGYDAVILNNVPRGPGGISDEQGNALASFVHDLGGGLVAIGGPDALGAGGWQGTELEKVLPLDMDVPAQRQIPKGALALIMHSCEFQDGNYWGAQCGIKAVEVLNARDEVGVVSFGGGGSIWDYPLSPKGDGSKVTQALKSMALGDMPSFDESFNLALNGGPTSKGMLASDARSKHMIVISDGDPQAPAAALIKAANDAKISISTVSVYPHDQSAQGLPPTMRKIAEQTGGRAYGPVNGNFSQLPQIFIKEATIVRRSLIQEDKEKGLPVKNAPSSSEVLKGIGDQLPGRVWGMVLSTRKPNPQVEVPLVAGPQNDPLLAHWQTGLGRALVFTSDAHNIWASDWVGSSIYDKFWAQAVRQVARPAESADFDVTITNSGGKAKIVVEALNKDNQFRNGLTIRGTVVGPDMKPHEVSLVQTAPGTYEREFEAGEPGNYVVGMSYSGADKQSGILRSGTVVNTSPELRDLKSNTALLRQIAERTGGRFISPFDTTNVALFDRAGLVQRNAPMPVWDLLLPFLIGLLLLDVAVRRIAWDWASIQRARASAIGYVRSFTTTRQVETTQSLDALRRVRTETQKPAADVANKAPSTTPNRSMKFEAREQVDGDITKVVGGASDKPVPPPPKKIEPKGGQPDGGHTSSLLEAKRRAQQKIREQEEGK
ncbi:MAG: hypothetical protein H7144_01040 [Burkholderiales bacterium]|nr:hypothetical protein [Phycisphaerae bacterium]